MNEILMGNLMMLMILDNNHFRVHQHMLNIHQELVQEIYIFDHKMLVQLFLTKVLVVA